RAQAAAVARHARKRGRRGTAHAAHPSGAQPRRLPMRDVERVAVAQERTAREALHRVRVEAVARLVVEAAARRRDGASEAEAAAAALRLTTGVARADRPADRGSRAAAIRHPDPHEVHWLAAD